MAFTNRPGLVDSRGGNLVAGVVSVVSGTFTLSGPNGAAVLPSNHNGNITLTLVGTGTAWDGTTVFAVSGVSGWAKVSQSVVDATHATVVVSCPAVASPPAGATGTLTVTESVTGAASQTVAVATPTLAASPNTGLAGGSAATTFTGTNTLWQGDNPQFTVSGGTGTSVGAATETSNTASSATVTYGSAAGTLTVTDPSTGAQCTIAVTAPPSAAVTAPSPARLLSNTAGQDVVLTGTGTSWTSGTTWSVSGMPGAAITNTARNGQVHTLTVTSSNVDQPGTLTFSNSIDGATATVQVLPASGALVIDASSPVIFML